MDNLASRRCRPQVSMSRSPHLCALLSALLHICSGQVHNLSLSVEEGLSVGTIVGDIRAGLPKETASSGFFISESRDSYVFRDLEIDGDTGIITTAKVLDRESVDRYAFVAATLDGEMVQVEIVVTDINDHSPVFARERTQLNISEQSPPGTRFHLEGAIDLDEGPFSTQGYQITEGNPGDMFKLEYKRGDNNVLNIDLILMGKLDREVADFYSLEMEAFDGGSPSKMGSMWVDINVLDENDNPPVFNQSEYLTYIWENAPVSTSVCQVSATDRDIGNNGVVFYWINRRQSDPGELFVIDNRTGLITLNKPLDYETQPYHKLIVQAQDDGAQPELGSTFVLIKVLDVNDNAPSIDIMFLSESGDCEVSEGAALGDYVARISVSDPDLADHQKIQVSLEGGDGQFILKTTAGSIYFLCVNGNLDRETADLYELKIVASDYGSPIQWSEQIFLLKVTDVNDNPPVFDHQELTVNISEDVPQGTAFLQVHAKDSDEGINSVVHYAILNLVHNFRFNINSKSGLITTASHLDHEEEPIIHFVVVATDSGHPTLSSTATVTVVLEDINDNEPVFERQVYKAKVKEHSPVDGCFLQVVASDMDNGKFGKLTFFLYDGFTKQEKSSMFRIEPDTGKVCIAQDIDRENGLSSFDAIVKAEDGGGLSSQAFLHIDVDDINDCRPEFNPLMYVTSVSSHTQPGTEVINVIASDGDSGSYGQVSYKLVPGEWSSLFTIDSETGVVYLKSTLNHLGSTILKVSVTAQDGGGLDSLLSAVITINILQSSGAPAVFERTKYLFAVPENAKIGTPVGTVQATNPSSSVDLLTYRISSGNPNNLFTIHPLFGLISTSQPLDHESYPYIILIVQSQMGSSPVYSSTQVNITITDLNDNAPFFHKESETVWISCNTLPGTVLFLAHAEDKDSGRNGKVKYSLQEDTESVFSIHPWHGMVYLNKNISKNTHTQFIVDIIAKDLGNPPLGSPFTLIVKVDCTKTEDILTFETLIYQAEVNENTQVDSLIIQVSAHGQSPQTYSDIIYSLNTVSGKATFGIHANSGWIYLLTGLDFESVHNYHFTVSARAQEHNASASAIATVIISVLDDNDNAPVFSQDFYFFTIQEGPVPHGLIGSVKATDLDSGRNAQLSYILLSDGKHFRINSNTGEIVNWVALDREQSSQHTLCVLVSDHGFPRHNASVTVYVLVTDINDNHPQFAHLLLEKELSVQVWVDSPAGTVVASLFAKDVDAGENGTVLHRFSPDDDLGDFEIDSLSGEIRIAENFYRRPRRHYKLTVIAKDMGAVPLEMSAVVHIMVVHAEKMRFYNFNHIFRHFIVKEDSRPGDYIGTVLTHESNREDEHTIVESDSSFHFAIQKSTGDLYLARELDFEITSHYFFKVISKDPSQFPMQNTSVFVSVTVQDVNDHTPWFLDDFIVIGINENLPLDTTVFTFNAKDGDGSLYNSALQYSITSNIRNDIPFYIDPSKGTLTTSGSIDREESQLFILQVTATDYAVNPQDQRSCSLTAKIIILDDNDNSPIFVTPHITYILEDAEIGSLVHHIIARDSDVGRNARVSYSILHGNELGVFALDETAGFLSLASHLDYETINTYILHIVAFDSGDPALSSTQTLTVSVMDVNDVAPAFEKLCYNATVPENHSPGEFVLKIAASDGDSEMNAGICFSLLPGPGYEYFKINSQTGVISTSVMLDRELQESYVLKVIARDSGIHILSSTATIFCTVLDDNDNAPEFMIHAFQVNIPENQEPGMIYRALATDRDAGENGTIIYSLVGDSTYDFFTINVSTGIVSATKKLDREERNNYTIIIEAHDLGSPQKTATMELLLNILDENDNSPVFSQNHYWISVSENLEAGSVVLTLTATDEDTGPSGDIMYSLSNEAQGIFIINNTSGVVSTAVALDRESKSQYIFKAIASDCSTQGPKSTAVDILIDVEDVNDNTPIFIQNPVNGQVTKDTILNQIITTVQAYDSDLGLNGTVSFSFAKPESVFDINSQTGDIWLKSSLPDGQFGTKVLQVIAADQGNPILSSSGLVFVDLWSEEAAISFSENVYEATIRENCSSGSLVTTVTAYSSEDDTSKLKYSIFSGSDNGTFSIDSDTGSIYVKDNKKLDYEALNKIQFMVLATSAIHISHCTVTVTLEDVNDNPPRFEESSYKTAVWEGQIFNTFVMQVSASDADSGPNGQTEYYILSGNQNEAFVIDSNTGILSTNTILDREIVPYYELVLHAVDKGSPQLTASTTIIIQVVDINDNAPSIPPMEPAEVVENLPAGYFVTKVSANDVDLTPCLTYSLTKHGNPGNKFVIDRYTGVISLAEALDYEENSHYTVQIVVSDSIHETQAELIVLVLDVNDNPPIFTQNVYQIALPEDTPVDSYVLTVSAIDRDSGLNAEISFRLYSSPFKGFYISSENGSIYTSKPLRYLTDSTTVVLIVEAQDGGDPVLTAVTSVEIHIQDVNDHIPHFMQAAYQINIPEDAKIGDTFLYVTALDHDLSLQNSYLDYSIISGNEQGTFCLETSVIPTDSHYKIIGNLLMCKPLDREKSKSYNLVVLASDRGTPQLNASAVVSVSVLDSNDNPPVFSTSEYFMEISESAAVGSKLGQVSAHDADEGVNAEISYLIVSGNDRGHFRVDYRTGSVELNHSLDYEDNSRFTLTVQATDNSTKGKSHTAFALVFVNVLDENDNAPYFGFPTLNCTILENLPASTPICSLHALDRDSGPYGHLTYSLLSSCSADYSISSKNLFFSVDAISGDIHSMKTLDYEQESQYCFVARAKDKGNKTATVQVLVDVESVDEFSPVFLQESYYFVLPENCEVGQNIGHVSAVDKDGGIDGVVLYSLVSPSHFFSINQTNGTIYLSATVYRMKGSARKSEDLIEFFVKASSPKLDSRSTSCLVVVNISSSAQTFSWLQISNPTINITVSVGAFLLLAMSTVILILRHRRRRGAARKDCFDYAPPTLNNSISDNLEKTNNHVQRQINLEDFKTQMDIKDNKEMTHPSRHSASSGHGSAEGDNAEDEEIKMINEHPCRKESGSALSERESRVPDSGIPQDSDQFSCQSEEGDLDIPIPEDIAEMTKNIHIFNEDRGKYSNQNYPVNNNTCKRIPSVNIKSKPYTPDNKNVFQTNVQSSVGDSLASLSSADEEFGGSYSWDYLLNWEPKFQPLASVFSDIAKLQDETLQKRNTAEETKGLIYPPPLITSVAQPGIRTVPPRLPTFMSRTAFPKYAHSPLSENLGLMASVMTPSFSPSLSLLTAKTPSSSPVVSEVGHPGPSKAVLQSMRRDEMHV
ncbi:protocadherin-23 [Polypterus senegalus]|uniref:protocadherin-23 n=1 Tax=Polypterus senegalus TaxID=55291 RepID=UPI0019659493|nr:protocadherin-23 [Polypterus senegalus]